MYEFNNMASEKYTNIRILYYNFTGYIREIACR
jgi:hypothetical protein